MTTDLQSTQTLSSKVLETVGYNLYEHSKGITKQKLDVRNHS